MFTGIIEQQGYINELIPTEQGLRIIIDASYPSVVPGESIAINGVCLTLLEYSSDNCLYFDISPETLKLTTLGQLNKGTIVNLERAMQSSSRFGGHYVSGHVDATAVIESIVFIDEYREIIVGDFPIYARMHLLSKGSITLDGISLTINDVNEDSIKLMLIPHTLMKTTWKNLKIGQRVNVEFDYLTRVVAHQLNILNQLKNEVKTR